MNQLSRALLAASGGAVEANYIEDVFSTYLYTGNGSTQTITNGIDLSGKGGLVWLKARSGAAKFHVLFDTNRGALNSLVTNNSNAQTSPFPNTLTAFNSNGFSIGSQPEINESNVNFASWTFRKQPKFFDVVTYTGNGSQNRQIAHSLNSTPGMIIVKRYDGTGSWLVWQRSINSNGNGYIYLNDTLPADNRGHQMWGDQGGTYTAPTSSVFTVSGNSEVNFNGYNYIAYLFAHDAGGFGASGTDNVISCGSFTASLSGAEVNLGWEPQWVIIKKSSVAGSWRILDVMRGFGVQGGSDNDAILLADSSSSETYPTDVVGPTATGFKAAADGSGETSIYIAIRRGPMRTPTTGTSVFSPVARSGTGANETVVGGLISDAALIKNRGSAVANLFAARLTRIGYLETSSTSAEVAAGTTILQANPWDVMDGVKIGTTSTITNASSNTFINYFFKRAPGFFDVVCYTGTGSATTFSHNLKAVPELMVVKRRSAADDWWVYDAATGNTKYQVLNSTATPTTSSTAWNNTTPTSSVFTVGTGTPVNASAGTYVAYLFATVAGVSKVGSYTGTGTTLQVNCGFTTGARFVLIKRTDSTGDWYVWDSARGIVAANDPHLSLNSTAAEVTTNDSVDPDNTGFVVNQVAATNINVNAATYIFLAIA